MGLYQRVRELWKQPKKNMPDLMRKRLISWRREPVTIKIDRPTRLDRARSLGYKAKPGIIVIRQRVRRGGRMRARIKKGRRSKHFRHMKVLAISYQQVAEQRVSKKYVNCEVLNSYFLAKDGLFNWYEVILLDKSHPVIRKSKEYGWVAQDHHKGRVFRGLTSSGKKSRGLMYKGKGAEKVRPSNRAKLRKAK